MKLILAFLSPILHFLVHIAKGPHLTAMCSDQRGFKYNYLVFFLSENDEPSQLLYE